VTRRALRWALVGVVVVLGAATLLFLRGPSFLQRTYYPLHYQTEIADSGARHRVSPFLIAAIINAESGWDAEARSQAGAVGLMQVLPATAKDLVKSGRVDSKRYPLDGLSDPRVNIEYGTAYMRFLVDRYHEIETALAAYNAGLRHADSWKKQGGNIRTAINFPETKAYVLRVMRGRDRYRQLYPKAFSQAGATK
jgi:soluble lytic murein transglycosylase